MNWDPRSAYTNTEMAVVINNKSYSHLAYSTIYQDLRRNAYYLTIVDNEIVWHDLINQTQFDSEPQATFFQKLFAWFSGALPVEDLL